MSASTVHASTITFTATATAGLFTTAVAPAHTTSHSTSLLSGAGDPTKYNPENPIILVIIQLFLIVALSRILNFFLAKLRQPRVLSEILAGVLLGPTAFGRIPGFSSHIFPTASLPFLNLLANLGLILFLFCVGLEVDFALFRRNLKPSLAVSITGLALPFGLGCALSIGLYNEFVSKEIEFQNFMLFIGTASSITAFPVLARILTDQRLLHDPVGAVVLASGVANDVCGWILLALSVALSASSQGQVVVYIILCAVGWMLVLWFIMRPLFDYLGKATGSYDGHGPNQTFVCAVLILVLVSAWVMEEIGISAIFGGFAAGLILPRKTAVHLTEKIKDLVLCLFIPLYFGTSGLKTNLGLLNTGIIWAWTVCIMVVAFSGKFFGCAIAAKLCGFSLREAGAVGSLMSCKGLIELIVLNIGLQAGIINQTVFSIYVLEALVLTFASTPLTLLFYPPHLRPSPDAPKADLTKALPSDEADEDARTIRSRFTIVLERFTDLSAVMVFTKLLAVPPRFDTKVDALPSSATDTLVAAVNEETLVRGGRDATSGVSIDTLRLVELTDRASAVLQASDSAEVNLRKDPLSSLYTTFASLNGVTPTSSFAIVPQASYADTVAAKARDTASDFVLVPWRLSKPGGESVIASFIPNPFEHIFGRSSTSPDDSSLFNSTFLRDLFASSPCDVGLFLDRGLPPSPETLAGHHHLFLPFFGGSDDRACLELCLQLAQSNPGISATVVVITREEEPTEHDLLGAASSIVRESTTTTSDKKSEEAVEHPSIQFTLPSSPNPTSTLNRGETFYPTQHSLQSSTADQILLELAQSLSLPRLTFHNISTSTPLLTTTRQAILSSSSTSARFTWLVGRGRRDAASHRKESLELLKQAERDRTLGVAASAEVRRCVGETGIAAIVSGVGEGVLVVQSRLTGGRRGKGV